LVFLFDKNLFIKKQLLKEGREATEKGREKNKGMIGRRG